MSDSRRTRIAAVLFERFATAMGFADAAWEDTEHETWLEDADAVIAELGIYEDEMGTGATRRIRIISDWEKP